MPDSELSTRHSLDLPRIQAVLFDLDGTLLALQKMQPPTGRMRRFYVATETPINYMLAILDRVGFDTWLQPIADWTRRVKGIGTSKSSRLIEGVPEVLALLATRYPVGVLTNRSRPQAQRFLDTHELHPHFRCLTSRTDLWRFKPHPQAVRHSARLLNVPPESVLMVGDMPVDMQTAHRAGAQAVGVLTGFATEVELYAAGATVVVPSVADLPELLGFSK
jgi:HAD superfamily hydrolase (TIGR01549 family)